MDELIRTFCHGNFNEREATRRKKPAAGADIVQINI
jgi:hypothetical protein